MPIHVRIRRHSRLSSAFLGELGQFRLVELDHNLGVQGDRLVVHEPDPLDHMLRQRRNLLREIQLTVFVEGLQPVQFRISGHEVPEPISGQYLLKLDILLVAEVDDGAECGSEDA